MKKILLALILLINYTASFAQSAADYETAVSKFQSFYNNRQADSIYAMMCDKYKSALSKDDNAKMMGMLVARFGQLQSYTLQEQKNGSYNYKTVFSKATMVLAVTLNSNNKLETFNFAPYQPDTTGPVANTEKSNIVLKTESGLIYGTLTMPEGTKKVPVALIIAGSGPTDRNGNTGSVVTASSYRMIADSLQKEGIACVRYDKRGVGESAAAAKKEENMRFDDGIDDAEGFVKMLKEDPRFSVVIIIGHSEGSLIGMIVAQREKVALVSVAGAGEGIDKIIQKQLANQSDWLATEGKGIMDSIKDGYTVINVSPYLIAMFRPFVQPYLRSWMKYDPQQEIKKVKTPILLVQGTTDLQVEKDQAEMLYKANPQTILKIVPGMNHVLKQAPADRMKNMETYADPALPLCPGFMPDLVHFIKHLNS